jgi:hypothetical protein
VLPLGDVEQRLQQRRRDRRPGEQAHAGEDRCDQDMVPEIAADRRRDGY